MFEKKALCCLIILMLLSLTLSSCDYEKRDTSPAVINIWTYYRGGQKKFFEAEIDEFNNTIGKEKNIIVKHKAFVSVDDINDNLIRSSQGDAGSHPMPDAFITYKGIGKRVNRNYKLINFEDYYTKEEIKEYVDDFINVGYIEEDNKNKLVMFPIAKSSDILLINNTEFVKFMNATDVEYEDLKKYESLVKVAEKYYLYTDSLTPEKDDGKALFGIDSVPNYFFVSLKQLGVDMLTSENGNTVLNLSKENARKIWNNYYVPVVKGHAGKQGNFVSEDIKIGKLIVGLSYTTSASYFPKKTYVDEVITEINLKVMHSPYMKDGSQFFINQGGGIFAVDTNEKKNKACIEFIKWITKKENNMNFTIRSSYFPVSKDSIKKDAISKYEKENNIDDNIVQTLNIGITQFKSMQSYTPETVNGYEDIRLIIEKEFAQFAKKDAKDIKKRISNGEDYNVVLKHYLSDEYFDKWYESFTKKINFTLANYPD